MDRYYFSCLLQAVACVLLVSFATYMYSDFTSAFATPPIRRQLRSHRKAPQNTRVFASTTCASHDVIEMRSFRVRSTTEMLQASNSRSIHAAAVTPQTASAATSSQLQVAISLGVTSKGSSWKTKDEISRSFPFFNTLMPSFCKTVTSGVADFHFFAAFDEQDQFFSNAKNLCDFVDLFHQMSRSHCSQMKAGELNLHFVHCSHNKRPAWAQNDASWAAYLMGMEYFYRINDDSMFISKLWLQQFIKTLQKFEPKNLGVVGPNHQGGNVAILTYDFIHKTHIEMFGFHYPRAFVNWAGDTWITLVYAPGKMEKLTNIQLKHTLEKGQRYKQVAWSSEKMKPILDSGKRQIERFVTLRLRNIRYTCTCTCSRHVVTLA